AVHKARVFSLKRVRHRRIGSILYCANSSKVCVPIAEIDSFKGVYSCKCTFW
uniref:Uncharacterized protein n=1 Tax=Aegilops tauschii subsp. strangulata TaxID=200361 RepID=A0A453RRV6_AEGTS